MSLDDLTKCADARRNTPCWGDVEVRNEPLPEPLHLCKGHFLELKEFLSWA
jgi:hypothetical protein